MLNSIFETRTQKDGLYKINLTIDEKEYFLYEDITRKMLKRFLITIYYTARMMEELIIYKSNIIKRAFSYYAADLHYGNEKTEDMYNTHDYIRKKGEMRSIRLSSSFYFCLDGVTYIVL